MICPMCGPTPSRTLRDQFVMAALKQFNHELHRASDSELKWVAEGCYRMADAMMAARVK